MRFVVLAWVLSRLLVLAVLLANGHAGALANWDGAWYGSVAAHGYEYAPDGRQHNVAFFPLLPMLGGLVTATGVAWPIAAGLVANVAFLGALALIYVIAERRYDDRTARWCVALAALLPPSLFCSVAYPQSLFLCASAAAILSFDGGRYLASSVAAAFASAASGLGIPLCAAMLADGIARRRAAAVAAAVIGFVGVGVFAAYCAVRFGDALAFVHAQRAWRSGFGVDVHAWRLIVASLASLDGIRQNVMLLLVPVGAVAVLVESRRLGRMMTIYGLLALGILACSGTPFSVDRNAYAVVPVLIALGAILRRVPAAGYALLAVSAILLVIDAGRFARFEWVA